MTPPSNFHSSSTPTWSRHQNIQLRVFSLRITSIHLSSLSQSLSHAVHYVTTQDPPGLHRRPRPNDRSQPPAPHHDRWWCPSRTHDQQKIRRCYRFTNCTLILPRSHLTEPCYIACVKPYHILFAKKLLEGSPVSHSPALISHFRPKAFPHIYSIQTHTTLS